MKNLLVLFLLVSFGCVSQQENVYHEDAITFVDEAAFLKKDMTLLTGTIIRYFDNGQLELSIKFKEGKLNGISKSWHKNGQLEEEENYVDGKKDGVTKGYTEDGLLWYKETWKNDEKINQHFYQ